MAEKTVRIGDYVEYRIPPSAIDHGYVIGFMRYGKNNIALLADEKVLGMPIHVDWLRIRSRGHDADCGRWRDRYMQKCPGILDEAQSKVVPIRRKIGDG